MLFRIDIVKRVGVVQVNEHDVGVALLTSAQTLQRFLNGWVRHLVLDPPLEFISAPKGPVNQRDIDLQLHQPRPNGRGAMSGERFVLAVVIGQEKEG